MNFLVSTLSDGGWVMWPLCLCALILWTGLGFRFHLFRYLNKQVNDQVFDISDQSFYFSNKNRFKTIIRSILLISPLLGLLGTVSGMIETFDSLGDMQLYSQSGGIASGISKALFTTQMGLVISAPGLIFSKYIERKIDHLDLDIIHKPLES